MSRRVWFITGCSRGLGLSLAQHVLDDGDNLVATARKVEDIEYLVQKYGSDRVATFSLDVTNVERVEQVVQAALDKFGRIDVLVNNAGYADQSAIEDTTIEAFRAMVETNFMGVVYLTNAVLPSMRENKSGRINQVSSIGGRMGSPGLGAYQSSKWAVNGFSTVLAAEVAPLGIFVTSCEPGGIKTDWAGQSMKKPPTSQPYEQIIGELAKFRDEAIVKHGSEPADIARSIIHISKVSDPPVRLLLGKDTVFYGQLVSEKLAESDKKWSHVTLGRF